MNKLDEAVQMVKDELEAARKQYLLIQQLGVENKIEQDKIVEQNINIKDRIKELSTSQAKADSKTKELDEREKQIIVKEKQHVFINQKMKELEGKMVETILREKKLKRDQEEYEKQKTIMNRQKEIYQKVEETENLRNTRLKLREDELEKEIARVKSMRL